MFPSELDNLMSDDAAEQSGHLSEFTPGVGGCKSDDFFIHRFNAQLALFFASNVEFFGYLDACFYVFLGVLREPHFVEFSETLNCTNCQV